MNRFHRSRRLVSVVTAVAALSLALVGCSSSSGEGKDEPLKIALLTVTSGPAATYGKPILTDVELLRDQLKKSGGIKGREIEIDVVDTAGDPTQTATEFRRLANDDSVVAIVGPYFSGEADVAVPLSASTKMPMIVLAGAVGIVDKSDWAFRAYPPDDLQISTALDAYLKEYPKVKKMVVVGDGQAAVTAATIKNLWPAILKKHGITIVDTITFDSATTDFRAIAGRIAKSGADGVAMSSLTPAAPRLVQQLDRDNVGLPVISSGHVNTVPTLAKVAGKAANGLVYPSSFNPDAGTDALKNWIGPYTELRDKQNPDLKGEPAGFSLEGAWYDAFQLVLSSLEEGDLDGSIEDIRAGVRDRLAKVSDFQGVSGPMSAEPNGDIVYQPTPVIAKDGDWVVLK